MSIHSRVEPARRPRPHPPAEPVEAPVDATRTARRTSWSASVMPHVYILRCADGTFYVGSTRNLQARLWQHEQGMGSDYTRERRPIHLAWAQEYDRVGDAYGVERKLHGWSHAKKQAVVDGNWHLLPGLARTRSSTSSEDED